MITAERPSQVDDREERLRERIASLVTDLNATYDPAERVEIHIAVVELRDALRLLEKR